MVLLSNFIDFTIYTKSKNNCFVYHKIIFILLYNELYTLTIKNINKLISFSPFQTCRIFSKLICKTYAYPVK